jgi:hypothetical protein
MSSFDWLEFETLSREVTDLEDRLAGARSHRNHGLMRLLEQQLGDTRGRRERVLEVITRQTASTAAKPGTRPRPSHKAATVVAADASESPEAEPAIPGEHEPAASEAPAPISAAFAELPEAAAPEGAGPEGVNAVWDRLTPAQIEEARRELHRRRTEILARHAEELKALDGDEDEIEGLSRAIEAFTRKFGSGSGAGGEVVRLDEGRSHGAHAAD